jgi:hypothetical protein
MLVRVIEYIYIYMRVCLISFLHLSDADEATPISLKMLELVGLTECLSERNERWYAFPSLI